jgi:glycyl-tRNA synthetase
MVDCRETKARYRADHVKVFRHKTNAALPMFAFMEGEPEPALKKVRKVKNSTEEEFEELPLSAVLADLARIIGPDTDKPGSLTEPRQFNLMFKTYVGAIQDESSVAYLRPETAQGIFLNFKNVVDTTRVRIPFGIAQIGKAFRNEVTPRNFIFRSREFEQMEMEWFCHPSEAKKWHDVWCELRANWWKSLGLQSGNLQLRKHDQDELAHYAKEGAGTFDIEYRFPFSAPGFGELEGVAHRGDYDLKQHMTHSKIKLEYFDQEKNERYLPHVIEPAAGLTRGVLAVLCEAYTIDESRPSKEFLKIHPRLAPIKAAIFPLVQKEGMPEIAQKLYESLRTKFVAQIDMKQAIGKRYARMDEAGTPFCFTIDGDTLTNQTVTMRDRDTGAQERIAIDQVERFLSDRIK